MRRSVFIGAEAGQALPAHVLSISITSMASVAVEVFRLDEASRAAGYLVGNETASNTPFSKQRLFVPALAGGGQAAYLDSDMIVFSDINVLFDAAGGAAVSSCRTRQNRDPQTSVMIFNVSDCQWDPSEIVKEIEQDTSKYRSYLYEFEFAGGCSRILPAEWNDLEYYDPKTTCLMHFTDMDTQPWLTSTNMLESVWLKSLRDAMQRSSQTLQILRESVQRFYVRPSLLWQAEAGWRRGDEIPLFRRLCDVLAYVPPHTLANGIPLGIGRRIAGLLESPIPRSLKLLILMLSNIVLLARKRRRLIVWATISNRKCIINRNEEAIV